MKIAVEGCSHGELDNIYASIAKAEEQGNFKTDLLLLCGDMQALRNRADLQCLAVPQKYRQMGDFHRYYSGEKRAPVLTLVIGGNHEASNYMYELYHGGWLAPNIYFLGEAGVVEFGGLTIAGASGIYKSHDYRCGRFERMPLGDREMRSIYHTREFDIWRLKLFAGGDSARGPDIVMSHDWPNTIEQHGDTSWLIKKKPYFKSEIQTSTLGSPPLMELLQTLQPKYWFSAHLHVKFAALLKHGGSATGGIPPPTRADPEENPEALDIDIDDLDAPATGENPDEINVEDIEDEDPPGGCDSHEADSASAAPPLPATEESVPESSSTRFLALSKCMPNQDFLQFIDLPSNTSFPVLRFVPRWLAILRATNHLMSLQKTQHPRLPTPNDPALLAKIEEEETWVRDTLATADDALAVDRTQHFAPTAAPTNTPLGKKKNIPLQWFTNPQTEALTSWLQIENKINRPEAEQSQPRVPPMPIDSPLLRFAAPPMPFAGQQGQQAQQPSSGGPPLPHTDEAEEIRRIEAASQRATQARVQKRAKVEHVPYEEQHPLRLDDEDDELALNARWKEGTG